MDKKATKKPPESHATSPLPDIGQSARVSSAALLGDHGELVIEHAGREYRLRVTQNGKLILTA